MSQNQLDGALFVQMVLAGHQSLENNKQRVNALNVFPVPDGDTGTNMSLSLSSGVNEMRRVAGQSLTRVADAVSTGLLMGARGNSGVILSQIFRGFSKTVSKMDSIDAKQFAEALQNGVTTAYQAVVKPVEGTILTVAKDAAKAAVQAAKSSTASLLTVMESALEEALRSLSKTPDLLPVLKQAGVVDSGGQGLVYVYQGFVQALRGEKVVTDVKEPIVTGPIPHGMPAPAGAMIEHEGEYGYCTEFIIRWNEDHAVAEEFEMESTIRDQLMDLGDSMLVVAAGDVVKVHIHSLNPGQVLEKAMTYGGLTRIKIDNMTEQHHNLVNEYAEESTLENNQTVRQPYGIVTVVAGEGLVDIFRSIGVGGVIEGGQTMNPSTEDIVQAIESQNADHIFVLPNNSNIIMATEQAKSVLGEDRVTVIPSKSIPQGMSAILAFEDSASIDENQSAMIKALERVTSGQLTRAVRDSHYQDFDIKEGDYMGLQEGKVVAVGQELDITMQELFTHMIEKDHEIVTLFYGSEVKQEEAEQLSSHLSKQFSHCEFEIHFGGQPLYAYIISVE